MNSSIEEYIKTNLAKGVPVDQIKAALIAKGWQQEAFQNYLQPTATAVFPAHAAELKNGRKPLVRFVSTSLILRVGLAFVFIYAAIFVAGETTGEKYVPTFVTNIIPITLFLKLFSGFEILLSLWLLSGKYSQYAGLVAAIVLTGISAFNLAFFGTIFRNIAIIAAALALTTL